MWISDPRSLGSWCIKKADESLYLVDSRVRLMHDAGATNDGFLPNALKRCFRLSGVLLKLCRLILGCAIKFLSVRFF